VASNRSYMPLTMAAYDAMVAALAR
jgi:hypothetical protein